MLIRKMVLADVEQVSAIETSNFSLPWSEKAFEDAIACKDALFLVAKEKEKILGYVGMYISFEEGEITNVAVLKDAQNSGIGKSLLEKAFEEAFVLGVERVVLEVRVSNEPAIHLYQKMGFENVGTRKNFYDFPKEDAFIMIFERTK